MGQTIMYFVDVQNDFMKRDGALFVSALEEKAEGAYGAERIIPNLSKLADYAAKQGMRVMGSVDRHFEGDAELMANGGPFPPHCMDGTEGQKMLPEVAQEKAVYVENKAETNKKEFEKIAAGGRAVIFEKQHYDVFTNPSVEGILEAADVKKVMLAGVATDYCDRAAALGMLKRGIEVYVVQDAIKEVNIDFQGQVDMEFGKKALDEMVEAGAKMIKTEEVLAGKYQ